MLLEMILWCVWAGDTEWMSVSVSVRRQKNNRIEMQKNLSLISHSELHWLMPSDFLLFCPQHKLFCSIKNELWFLSIPAGLEEVENILTCNSIFQWILHASGFVLHTTLLQSVVEWQSETITCYIYLYFVVTDAEDAAIAVDVMMRSCITKTITKLDKATL